MLALVFFILVAAILLDMVSRDPTFPFPSILCFEEDYIGGITGKFRYSGVWFNGAPVYRSFYGDGLYRTNTNHWRVKKAHNAIRTAPRKTFFPTSVAIPQYIQPFYSAPCDRKK
jgi:hypothetical protein